MFDLRLFCSEFRFRLLYSAQRGTAIRFGSLRALERMLCTDFFDLQFIFEGFHTLTAGVFLDSFSSMRLMSDEVFFQWTDAPDVLLAMKYLRET